MTTKPKTHKPAAKTADPIFAAIAEHKVKEKEWLRLSVKLETAKLEAKKTYGERPELWIKWRNRDAISESGIDYFREQFLGQSDADHDKIEGEYQEAKARLAAAKYAAIAWDYRTGTASLREEFERAETANERAGMQMARTKPMTPAGAAAMINYARCGLSGGEWEEAVLRTVARALTQMNAEAA